MSEFQIIQNALERAAQRRRWERALFALWRGLLLGALLWLVALIIFKLTPLPASVLLWVGLGALSCPLVGFVIGFWRKPSLPETARWVDVKQNLRERMSTALEVAALQPPGTWRDLILHDAATHAQGIEPKKLVPFSLPKAARWAALLLVLAIGLGFVPEYRSPAHVQKKSDEKVIQDAGKQVAELTKRELAHRPPALESTKQALEAVSELGERLEKVSLTRTDALKDLANASEKLKDELQQLTKDPALKKMEQAARSPSGRTAETAAGLQKQMDALQKELDAKTNNPEALDQLRKEMEKVQEAAQALASKSGQAADTARQQLSAALNALNQQADAAGVDLPQIDEAIAALAAAHPDRFLKEIAAALHDLDKLRDLKQKLAALQAQAEKLGKDLAEQLKHGQAEAAADTLEKLAEKLNSSNLSPEELGKILEEVSQALPEAKEYGPVADLLKQAAQQMKSGDKPNASESLAAAAKELKDLLQQMNDAEAMMAALDNLDKASQCIGMGLGWGQCQSRGIGMDWFGQGGKGAGTSASDRGLADRPPEELTAALDPTKVKGQISPGAPMPSITLKGVSIKGTSRVQYEEAATAAQSEAQSALSQDKVPRAYQGAVKDYFDDLKK